MNVMLSYIIFCEIFFAYFHDVFIFFYLSQGGYVLPGLVWLFLLAASHTKAIDRIVMKIIGLLHYITLH